MSAPADVRIRGAALLRTLVQELAAAGDTPGATELWRAEVLRLSAEDLEAAFDGLPLVDVVHLLAAARREVDREHDRAAADSSLAEGIGLQVGRFLRAADLLGLPLFGLPAILSAIDEVVTLVETGRAVEGVQLGRKLLGELLGLA